jgi:hypothetical protein
MAHRLLLYKRICDGPAISRKPTIFVTLIDTLQSEQVRNYDLLLPVGYGSLAAFHLFAQILDMFLFFVGAFHRNSWYVKDYNNAKNSNETIKFYDSNTGNLLFEAGIGRSLAHFWNESGKHGWPSFRDQEVNWEFVRCLSNGECVSLHGTHLVRRFLVTAVCLWNHILFGKERRAID